MIKSKLLVFIEEDSFDIEEVNFKCPKCNTSDYQLTDIYDNMEYIYYDHLSIDYHTFDIIEFTCYCCETKYLIDSYERDNDNEYFYINQI